MKNQNQGIGGYLIMALAAVLTFLFIVSCENTQEICGEYVGVKGRYLLLKVNPDSEHTTEVPYDMEDVDGIQFGDYICLDL